MTPIMVRSRKPLADAQQRLWFIDQLEGQRGEYNMPEALRLRGALDIVALRDALQAIVDRHDILRTRFGSEDGVPAQVIATSLPLTLPLEDLSAQPRDEQERRVNAAIAHECTEPFDLATGPLLRTRLLRLGQREHVFLRTCHHIVFDAWSWGIFNRELGLLYDAMHRGRPNPLSTLTTQYTDYAVRQRTRQDDAEVTEGLSYWKQQLAGMSAEPLLPIDRPRPARRTYAADEYRSALSVAELAALRDVARRHRATLYVLLLAAFAVVLARYSALQDVAVGSPIANRPDPDLEGLIGCFVNSLVLRVRVRPDDTLADLLHHVRRTTLDAQRHSHVPLERVVEAVAPHRSHSGSPLFHVMFALQNVEWGPPRFEDVEVDPIEMRQVRLRHDLSLHAFERDGSLMLSWLYSSELFDRERIERMSQAYLRVLREILRSTDTRQADLPLLDADEHRRIIHEWNITAPGRPGVESVPRLFERNAASMPDRVAIDASGQQMTYRCLDSRADAIAGYLVRRRIGEEHRIAVLLHRSPDLITAALGVLKAGAACVPLDHLDPRDRLALILADSRVDAIVTTPELRDTFGAVDCPVLFIDDAISQGRRLERRPLTAAALAYVLCTSGSTGRPKAVEIPHTALAQHATEVATALPGVFTGRYLQDVSPGFSKFVRQVFAPLCNRGAIVIVPPELTRHPADLMAYVVRHGGEVLDLVPAAFLAWIGLMEQDGGTLARLIRASGLRSVLLASELLPVDLLQRWRALLPDRPAVEHLYGQTETGVATTYRPAAAVSPQAGAYVPIGRPIPHARVHVLDGHLQPVPQGTAGEIHVGGAGLARGYGRAAALTAQQFVPDPFGPSCSRLYRTGNRGRYLDKDGTLECLGRADDQVKVRGYRVELGEIAAVLRTHAQVADAVVAVEEPVPGDQRLVAWLLCPDGAPDLHAVRRLASAALPAYMIPAAFVVKAAWPLTSNGKLDREALRADTVAEREAPTRPPLNLDERLLCEVFAEILHCNVSPDDDFFALGGHSLLAPQVVSQIRRRLGVDVTVRSLFESPSPAALAQRLRRGCVADTLPLVRRTGTGSAPLTDSQRVLWDDYVAGREAGGDASVVTAVRLKGRLDVGAFTHALRALQRRHHMLHTRFVAVADGVMQVVDPTVAPVLECLALPARDPNEELDEIDARIWREVDEPFDLATGATLRLRLIALSATDHVLVRSAHRIAFDAWSAVIFHRELFELYAAAVERRPAALVPLAIQFGDYARWQAAIGQPDQSHPGVDYWRRQLADLSDSCVLAPDRSVTALPDMTVRVHRERLCGATLQRLKALAVAHHATLYMTLLAAFGTVLARQGGRCDLVLATPTANRTEPELEGVIGSFAKSVLVRMRLRQGRPFAELLDGVRTATLETHRYEDVPIEQVCGDLLPSGSLDHRRFPQIGFTSQSERWVPPRFDGLEIEPVQRNRLRLRPEVALNATPLEGELACSWMFNEALFDRRTIQSLAGRYSLTLASVCDDPMQAVI